MQTDPSLASECTGPTLRFSMRQLLWLMAGMCGVFASFAGVGGLFSIALAITVLVVAAHVFSTSLGTRLRTSSSANARRAQASGQVTDDPFLAVGHRRVDVRDLELPSAQHLQQRAPVIRGLVWFVAGGAIIAGGLSTALLLVAFGQQMRIEAVLAGILAATILGAGLAFVLASFLGITRRVWREAVDGASARPAVRPSAVGEQRR